MILPHILNLILIYNNLPLSVLDTVTPTNNILISFCNLFRNPEHVSFLFLLQLLLTKLFPCHLSRFVYCSPGFPLGLLVCFLIVIYFFLIFSSDRKDSSG